MYIPIGLYSYSLPDLLFILVMFDVCFDMRLVEGDSKVEEGSDTERARVLERVLRIHS